MIPHPASATTVSTPTPRPFMSEFLVAQLSELIQEAPAYVQRSARSLLDTVTSEWSVDTDPAQPESNPEEEEEPP